MASLSLLKGKTHYRGDWSAAAIYQAGDVVKGSNNQSYKCSIDATSGAGHDPVSDATNWSTLVASTASYAATITATQVDRVSGTSMGINAGSTWAWYGPQWVLEQAGNAVTLVRMKQNCNCNCNCNCSSINCNCASNCDCNCDCDCYSDCQTNCPTDCNCNCSTYFTNECMCASQMWQGQWITWCQCNNCYATCACNCYSDCYGNCVSNCDCTCNCDCYSNCNCVSNCNCNCAAI